MSHRKSCTCLGCKCERLEVAALGIGISSVFRAIAEAAFLIVRKVEARDRHEKASKIQRLERLIPPVVIDRSWEPRADDDEWVVTARFSMRDLRSSPDQYMSMISENVHRQIFELLQRPIRYPNHLEPRLY